jgi:aryl-alcohol dehydrogenase-like predicted oxidoreductase
METNKQAARRDFLASAAALGAGAVLGGAAPAEDNAGAMPQRPLGRTGVQVSALGLGGHHLGDVDTIDDAIKLVHEAIDGGITFFDNCWEYWNGRSEDWLGRALKGKRDQVFLMTKVCTHGRAAPLAMKMLHESLRRLQTDHLDLWQIHGVGFDNDPDWAYLRGGVLEALDRARREGKTRYVGFTGHKSAAVHLRMVQMGYPFDAVQMPFNPFDANFQSFEQQVLPELNRRGIAALGMKPMGGTADAVKKGVFKPEELLRYAMSLPVATTISGMDSPDVLRKNLKLAQGFKPMSEAEMQALRDRCKAVAADARFEPYKVSLKFDNPHARIPHEFPLDETQKEVKEMFHSVMGATPSKK